MTSASDEKWRTFNCFFQSAWAKDLSAPLYIRDLTDFATTRQNVLKILDRRSKLSLLHVIAELRKKVRKRKKNKDMPTDRNKKPK